MSAQPAAEITQRGDGKWWKWDGLKWIGPFETADDARRSSAQR